MAAVTARRALVHLGAVELVDAAVALQALAHVRARGVDAARVGVAVVAFKPTLGQALVHICGQRAQRTASSRAGPKAGSHQAGRRAIDGEVLPRTSTAVAVPAEADVAVAGVRSLQIEAGGVLVARVALRAVIDA